jgi:hypothetical protein
MSNAYLVQVMTIVLVSVMTVLLLAAWILLGVMTERHPRRYALYRLLTTLITVTVSAIIIYLVFGPGNSLF